MENRRDFLKHASLLMAGGIAGTSILSSCCGSGSARKKHIGLVIYSLRDDVKKIGIQKVLEIVAEMGYVNIEVNYNEGKFYDMVPFEFKKMVEDLGMKATGAHLSRQKTDNHNEDMAWWKTASEAFVGAGMKYMVMSSWPVRGERTDPDNVKRSAEYFNEIGMLATGAGIAFGYHNHAYEFRDMIDNTPIYDLMLDNTDPKHVFYQNDVYWTQMGGYDPVMYLKKYPGRFKTLHIKDEKAVGVSGMMDFKAIFEQAYANGIKDWYVEVEEYDGTPQEDVKKSYDFLAKADYVK